jgi:hypothetical protein
MGNLLPGLKVTSTNSCRDQHDSISLATHSERHLQLHAGQTQDHARSGLVPVSVQTLLSTFLGERMWKRRARVYYVEVLLPGTVVLVASSPSWGCGPCGQLAP